MNLAFEFVALFSTALFAGAALYISLVEHPARLECGTALAATQFGPSYRRATRMQVPLAILGCISAVAAWWLSAESAWLVGGILIGCVIPFTLISILPTNKRLLDPSLDLGSETTPQLLTQWARLHAVRTLVSLSALAIFLVMLVSHSRR